MLIKSENQNLEWEKIFNVLFSDKVFPKNRKITIIK